jgi:hypothetical protein
LFLVLPSGLPLTEMADFDDGLCPIKEWLEAGTTHSRQTSGLSVVADCSQGSSGRTGRPEEPGIKGFGEEVWRPTPAHEGCHVSPEDFRGGGFLHRATKLTLELAGETWTGEEGNGNVGGEGRIGPNFERRREADGILGGRASWLLYIVLQLCTCSN